MHGQNNKRKIKGGELKMAKGEARIGRKVVPQAHKALDNLKYEIAAELGLPVKQGSEDYWGNVTSRDCGAVGGHMVRRMIQLAETQLINTGGRIPEMQAPAQPQQAQQTT